MINLNFKVVECSVHLSQKPKHIADTACEVGFTIIAQLIPDRMELSLDANVQPEQMTIDAQVCFLSARPYPLGEEITIGVNPGWGT